MDSMAVCSLFIESDLLLVLRAVYFNNDFQLDAGKIDYVSTDGHLPSKFIAFALPISQPSPHYPFGVGLIFSQLSR